MSTVMQEIRAFFAAENIRLEEMVHFPLSGNGWEVRPSDRLQELLTFEVPSWLPPELRQALGDMDDDEIDDMDVDDLCDRLQEGGIDGWFIKISTPARDRKTPGWGCYATQWFYCPDLSDLLPKARAWLEERKAKWAQKMENE